MTGDKFFFVFRVNGRLVPSVYHDDPPTPQMLKGQTVVFKRQLEGKYLTWSADELLAEFQRRMETGNLPPDNMVKPPAEKPETRVSWDIDKRPWSTGDLERELRDRKRE